MKTLEIYKVENLINGKVYIGLTSQGYKTRWYKHCSDSGKSNFPIHNAIRKHGRENFEITIIEDCSQEDYEYLKQREIYWISEYDSCNRDVGYNLTKGGDGTCGRITSDKTKELLRIKALGRIASEETKQKMSESQKNRVRDIELQKEISKKANEARWSNKEKVEEFKNNHVFNKPVIQYSKDGSFIKEHISLSKAAEYIKKVNGDKNIGSCARGKLKTAYGFKWKYKIC